MPESHIPSGPRPIATMPVRETSTSQVDAFQAALAAYRFTLIAFARLRTCATS